MNKNELERENERKRKKWNISMINLCDDIWYIHGQKLEFARNWLILMANHVFISSE